MRILAAAWQRLELELAPLHVIGCRAARNGRRDDIEIHCLPIRRLRAGGLLRVGKRLLCTFAGYADGLGRSGFSPNGDRLSGY